MKGFPIVPPAGNFILKQISFTIRGRDTHVNFGSKALVERVVRIEGEFHFAIMRFLIVRCFII